MGGETAEHPGLLEPDEYDLAGAATGVVEADEMLGPDRVRPGDVVVALGSSGLHSNGYSLVRRILQVAGWSLDRHVEELGASIGAELLTPTRVYAADVLDLAAALGPGLHALSHVTGGGLAANLARVLPPEATAVLERGSWRPAPVFGVLAELGGVPREDLERTFNLGVGMVAVTSAGAASAALERLAARGVPAWVLGEVAAGEVGAGAGPAAGGTVRGTKGVDGGAVRLVGNHPS